MNGALTAQKFLPRRRQFATREKNWTGRGIRQGFVEELKLVQWRRIGDHIPSQTIFSSKIADLTLVVSLCLTLATDGRIDTTSTIIYTELQHTLALAKSTYLVRNYYYTNSYSSKLREILLRIPVTLCWAKLVKFCQKDSWHSWKKKRNCHPIFPVE